MEGDSTQIPSGKADECNRDFSPIIAAEINYNLACKRKRTEGQNKSSLETFRMGVLAFHNRALCDYVLAQMIKRGAESWTSPDPALRCAIATVNVPPIQRMDLETWMWKTHKIRIRGGEPSKLRLSTPYYLQKKDIDRFLEKFDEYKRGNSVA